MSPFTLVMLVHKRCWKKNTSRDKMSFHEQQEGAILTVNDMLSEDKEIPSALKETSRYKNKSILTKVLNRLLIWDRYSQKKTKYKYRKHIFPPLVNICDFGQRNLYSFSLSLISKKYFINVKERRKQQHNGVMPPVNAFRYTRYM